MRQLDGKSDTLNLSGRNKTKLRLANHALARASRDRLFDRQIPGAADHLCYAHPHVNVARTFEADRK
jgi:hypothetical protein